MTYHMTHALTQVQAERERQLDEPNAATIEALASEGEYASAAVTYLTIATNPRMAGIAAKHGMESDPRKCLVIAAALVIGEMERYARVDEGQA